MRLARAIDTHTHAGRVTALGDLQDRTGCGTVMGQYTRAECVSVRVADGEIVDVDGVRLQALYTPGYTDESFSFVLAPEAPRAVFSGDAGKSWDSITGKLFHLPDATILYPAHDYEGWTSSSIGEGRRHNPRLAGKTREQYIEIMHNLKLPKPALMDVAVPANLACGRTG